MNISNTVRNTGNLQVSDNWKKLGQGMDFSAYMPPKPKGSTYKSTTNPTSFTGSSAFNTKNAHSTWSDKQRTLNPNFKNPLTVTGNAGPSGALSGPDRSKLNIGSLGDAMKQNYALPGQVSPVFKDAAQNQSPLGGSVPERSGGGLVAPPQSSDRSNQITDISRQAQEIQTQLDAYKANQTQKQTKPERVKGVIKPPQTKTGDITDDLRMRSRASNEQERMNRLLEEQSRRGEEIGRRAGEISDRYGSEIERVGQLGAGAVAGAKSTGTEVVGRGNAQLASESASNRIASLSAAQAAALQGTQQQLTGAEQGITGLTNAMQGMNTQQQTGVNALGTAGNLAMPSPTQYGQTVFDPQTGGFTGAGGQMDPSIQAQSLAQQVMSGAMTYDQAAASLGYAGNVGTNFLNNAITGAGGNPLNLQAQGAADQANVATRGTAVTDIARQGLQTMTDRYENELVPAAEYAHKQALAVSDIMAQTGLNNISSQDYTKAINSLKTRFSDEDMSAFTAAFIEAQQAYSTLLASTGGTPSGREEQAISVLDINSSAAAINAAIQELENAVSRRLESQFNALQRQRQNLGTGATTGGGGGGTWDW